MLWENESMNLFRLNVSYPKLKLDSLFTTIILVLALGFRTNFMPAEKNLSTIAIIVLYCFMIFRKGGHVVVTKSKRYIIWYSFVVLVCAVSRFWAKTNVDDYIYALIKDTYIPFVFVILSMEHYISISKDPKKLIDILIIAELVTVLRAVIYTPWGEMLHTFDSRLFASGLGQNYNDFTTQMTLIAIIISYLSFHFDKKYKKWFWLFMVLILISGSRKSIVIAIGGYCISYFLGCGQNIVKIIKRAIPLMVVIAIGICILLSNAFLYDLIGSKLVTMVQSLGLSSSEIRSTIDASNIDHSMHGRAVLRELAWNTFTEYPILGIGYYNFQYVNSYGLYAHNNYLEILADLGVVGFITYYSMYLVAIFECIKDNKRSLLFRFVLVFMILLLVMEYAQITFFRLFALVPLIAVLLWKDYSNKKGEVYVQKK